MIHLLIDSEWADKGWERILNKWELLKKNTKTFQEWMRVFFKTQIKNPRRE